MSAECSNDYALEITTSLLDENKMSFSFKEGAQANQAGEEMVTSSQRSAPEILPRGEQ